jgi:predicted Zn-dependent protease
MRGRHTVVHAMRPLAVATLITLAAPACSHEGGATETADAIRRGDALATQHKYREAAAEYAKAVAMDRSNGRLRFTLANTYRKAQQWSEASKEAIRAADLLPDDNDAQLLAADMLMPMGRHAEAVERMNRLLTKSPHNVGAIVRIGIAKASLRNSTWALFQLKDSIGDDARFETERTKVRTVNGDTDDAAAEYWLWAALGEAPDSHYAQIALANFLWATGRPDESEELLRAAMPAYAIAVNALGVLLASRGRFAEAEPLLKSAARDAAAGRSARLALVESYRISHRDADALALLATMRDDDTHGDVSMQAAAIEFESGDHAGALRRLDAVLARQPWNAPILAQKGGYLLVDRQIDLALKTARAAVSADSGSSDAHALLGRTLAASGDLEAALAEYLEAARLDPFAVPPRIEAARLSLAFGRDRQALVYAQEATRRQPRDRVAALLLVQALVRNGHAVSAEMSLAPFERTDPKSADVLVLRAMLAAARGRVGDARADYTRALGGTAYSLDAALGLATLDLDQGKVDAARHRIEALPADVRDNPAVLRLAVGIYSVAKDDERLEAARRRVVELDRRDINAVLALDALLLRPKRIDDARAIVDRGLQRDPESVELRTASALLLEKAGKAAEALAMYEALVAGSPTATTAASRLAVLYADQVQKLETALALATRAYQAAPDNPAANDALGWVYERSHLAWLGLPYLERAVVADPNEAAYHFHLASAYQDADQSVQAKRHFAEAMRLDPSSKYANNIRAASLAR